MAILDRQLNPSRGELRRFGALLGGFLGVIGGIVLWRADSITAASVIWSIGIVTSAVYYAVPPLQLPIFRGWMYAVFPIGWLISHAALSAVYYLVLTPMGLFMRVLRYDPMKRNFRADQVSYWVAYDPATKPKRYFRQF